MSLRVSFRGGVRRMLSAGMMVGFWVLFSGLGEAAPECDCATPEKFAKHFIVLFQQGDFEKIKPYMDTAVFEEASPLEVEKVVSIFPRDSVLEMQKLYTGVQYFAKEEGYRRTYTHFVKFKKQALKVETVVRVKNGQYTVLGFHFDTVPLTMMSQWPFWALKYLTLQNFLVLLGCLNIGLIVGTLVVFLRSSMEKKWLWMPFLLLGIGQISVSWIQDSELQFSLLSLQLPAFLSQLPSGESWMLTVSYPLGATILLWKLLSYRMESTLADA